MDTTGHGTATHLTAFSDAKAAFARIEEIYDESAQKLRAALAQFEQGKRDLDVAGANYPYVGITGGVETEAGGAPRAYGTIPGPGTYGITLTRPALFKSYYIEQISLLLRRKLLAAALELGGLLGKGEQAFVH